MFIPRLCRSNHKYARFFSTATKNVSFTVIGPNDYSLKVSSPPGRNLMKVLKALHVDYLPCVCNGTLQCSTCHVKVQDDIPETDTTSAHFVATPPCSIEELDMLDIAADADNNSRLSCQLTITAGLEGAIIKIPNHISNYMDDPDGTPIPTHLLRK